jgi:hypothetical protein
LPQGCQAILAIPLKHFLKQLLLRTEMGVQHWLGDARRFRKAVCGRGPETACCKLSRGDF